MKDKTLKNIAEINQHLREGIDWWATTMLMADADEWAYNLTYCPRDVMNACLIFQHICSNVGIKAGRIDAEKAVEFGLRLRQLVMDMTGFDPAELAKNGGEDEKD